VRRVDDATQVAQRPSACPPWTTGSDRLRRSRGRPLAPALPHERAEGAGEEPSEEEARHEDAEDEGVATAACRCQCPHALGERVPHRLQVGGFAVAGRPRTAPPDRRPDEARLQQLRPVYCKTCSDARFGMLARTTMATEG
jgi:hypothetical protein